jgi:hypothetical protein
LKDKPEPESGNKISKKKKKKKKKNQDLPRKMYWLVEKASIGRAGSKTSTTAIRPSAVAKTEVTVCQAEINETAKSVQMAHQNRRSCQLSFRCS